MLASLSMTNTEYQLWRNGIPYVARVTNEQDYEEFNDTHLISSLTPVVCVLPFLIYFHSFLYIASHDDVQMGYLCQVVPAVSAFIDPPRLPWSVYAYGPNGFACEHVVGHNTNVMAYPFLKGTQVVSSLPSLTLSFLSSYLLITYSNIVFFSIQPTIQEHEEHVQLVGNLKLQVTEYSRQMYGPRGLAYLGDGDDDDDGDGGVDTTFCTC